MFRSFALALLPIGLLTALCLAGCGPAANQGAKGNGTGEKHVHEHDHAEEGPHGGHLIELAEPGQPVKEEYHVEWSHDEESGKVTVWILDGKAKNTVPIAAETVLISVAAGDDSSYFPLYPVDRTSGEKATAFKFETTSKELLGKLETVGDAVAAEILVDLNGKPYEGKFEKHEEHDHAGHKH